MNFPDLRKNKLKEKSNNYIDKSTSFSYYMNII